MEFILDWVSTYGYVAIYFLLVFGIVGLPVPDETMMVFCGYLISIGTLKLVPTFVVCFLGSASGITFSYIIGRTLGLGFIHKYGPKVHVTEKRLESVHQWFERVGHWALFVGYYIAGVRHVTAILAGTSKLELRTFMLYSYTGALVWVSTFLTLGYFVGSRWKEMAHAVEHNMLIVSVIVIALALGFFLYRRYRKNRKKQA